MPRSCSSGDMAGTFMLYPPGTDGAAVTDVRLPGSRSSQHSKTRNTQARSKAVDPGFTVSGCLRLRPGCVRPTPGLRPGRVRFAHLPSLATRVCDTFVGVP